ncbi:hypothetical protein GCM10009682_05950 [Luedemannella flava]|uniref:Uncharacterized protein n=1 Tax=Luedemannella flava TaxID=349316 RepID=A0ABN2LGC2_9ACTN
MEMFGDRPREVAVATEVAVAVSVGRPALGDVRDDRTDFDRRQPGVDRIAGVGRHAGYQRLVRPAESQLG